MRGGSIKSTLTLEEVDLDEYAAVIVLRGWAPGRMRTKPSLLKLVKDADEEGLVISAI